MIKKLEIKNFKSIKEIALDCKRINIFIGEPNTGKSNILETLGIFSCAGYSSYGSTLRDFVRFIRVSNLFYDESLDEPITINLDDSKFRLLFKNGRFEGQIHFGPHLIAGLGGDYDNIRFHDALANQFAPFKFYRFRVQDVFPRPESEFLLPPYGANLMSLLMGHKELRATANQLFANFGLKLNLRPQENKIEVLKQLEDVTITYPYSLTSDTLQRTIFHMVAILSNKDSVIIFEEPESYAFPYYTKYLAESIALDARNNQFFVSTHNPYILLPLIQKAPKDDVAVFIAYFKDYQTKVRPLSAEEIEEIMEIDVFSNLDRFLGEKG